VPSGNCCRPEFCFFERFRFSVGAGVALFCSRAAAVLSPSVLDGGLAELRLFEDDRFRLLIEFEGDFL
jgi:hypothetical protein